MDSVLHEQYVNIAKKTSYLSPTKFLFSSSIYEYDIRQANINVLYAAGKLSDSELLRLSRVDKRTREIEIGKWIARDIDIYNVVYLGITAAKIQLLESNAVVPANILRIANDAVYIISPHPLTHTSFIINKNSTHQVTFICKGHYSSYVALGDVIVLINSDGEEWDVDVKGIGDEMLILHEKLLGTICSLIQSRAMGGVEVAAREFNSFFQMYTSLELPIEYYREFNAASSYTVKNSQFKLLQAPSIDVIDINFNLNLLRTLYAYLISK